MRHSASSSRRTACAALLIAAGALTGCGKARENVDEGGGGTVSDCVGCHGSLTGAHAGHTTASAGTFGDTGVTADFSGPTTTSYAFGCGNCHSLNPADHGGAVAVVLSPAGAPAGSLKARNDPGAAYTCDAGTGACTCSGVYCHSSGQANPIFVTSPDWKDSSATVGCGGCHGNPPNRTVDGTGAAYGNSHVAQFTFNTELIATGHFAGLPAQLHEGSAHVGEMTQQFFGDSSSPITCQTCHFRTANPTYTGPSGFYYWNPDGTYDLDPSDPAALAGAIVTDCTGCHSPTPPAGNRVMPYFHVNGVRDVDFDTRTTLTIPGTMTLPTGPNAPTRPYWYTGAQKYNSMPDLDTPVVAAVVGRTDAGFDGTTLSLHLGEVTWDAGARRCSNVACHFTRTQVTWGEPLSDPGTCTLCHSGY